MFLIYFQGRLIPKVNNTHTNFFIKNEKEIVENNFMMCRIIPHIIKLLSTISFSFLIKKSTCCMDVVNFRNKSTLKVNQRQVFIIINLLYTWLKKQRKLGYHDSWFMRLRKFYACQLLRCELLNQKLTRKNTIKIRSIQNDLITVVV